jgi:hypothetical protein
MPLVAPARSRGDRHLAERSNSFQTKLWSDHRRLSHPARHDHGRERARLFRDRLELSQGFGQDRAVPREATLKGGATFS